MTDNEKEFVKNVNIDKAKNKTSLAIFLIVLSLLSYAMPLWLGAFDFGIIFEAASFVFLLLARNAMTKYDENRSKRYVICSMVSIGWILIYDIIFLLSSMQDMATLLLFGFEFFLGEILLVVYLILLFAIHKNLAKADNPIKYRESTDWFYEEYEGKENNHMEK